MVSPNTSEEYDCLKVKLSPGADLENSERGGRVSCSIEYCRRIHDAKKSNINVSEDRIKEHFIKRFLKQNRSVSGS